MSVASSAEPVVVSERRGRSCRITLNRPAKRNALNDEVRLALDALLSGLQEDTDIAVVVLTGTGPSFSAGVDVTSLPATASSWASRRRVSGGWQRTLAALEALPQATVASLRGHCIGGAALLACCCDLRIGDPTVEVAIPELALGIPLTWGGVPRLARELGLPVTRDLVMTGRRLSAEAALACGFLQRLATAGELEALTEEVVGQLLDMPAAPLAMTKALTHALGGEGASLASWADADLLHWALAEPESRQAAASYLRQIGLHRPDRHEA
jgi:enoyl-CoA hydratase/carnithine racemase